MEVTHGPLPEDGRAVQYTVWLPVAVCPHTGPPGGPAQNTPRATIACRQCLLLSVIALAVEPHVSTSSLLLPPRPGW